MELLEKIKTLPEKPGCYLYYNDQHKVIYVGKAKNLKRRVASYFNRVHNIKTTRLMREIVDLEVFVVNNERESLLLEENLIKKFHPRFNILLNDDKAYPYIIITNEKDPQYKYVRAYDKSSLKSYGPLPQGASARTILNVLESIFPLRRCKGNLGKPCLYYHLNQCSGACFKEVESSYYQQQIKHIDKFFKGRTQEVVDILNTKMHNAAANLQFEEAQRIKDSLKGLQLALAKNDVELTDELNRDVIAYTIVDQKISITTLFYRSGKLLFKDELITSYDEQDLEDILSIYINQIYAKNMIPDQIIIPEIIDFDFLHNPLKQVSSYPINKLEKSLFALALTNAVESLRQSDLHSQTINNNEDQVLKELQTILGLDHFPYHIEMFDISHIANEFVTGSCVVYKGGQPAKSDFRKYNIEIVQKDDPERMANMILRHYQKGLAEYRELPDLIIVDGGIQQMRAANRTLQQLNLEQIPVVGLVKDDFHRTDHLLAMNENPISLNRKSPLYNLLSAIQIRVDTFAKTGFRKKQNQALITSELETIPGLGKKKIQALFKNFSTLSEMKKASFAQLNAIVKNQNTTKLLCEYLNSNV